MWRTHSAIMIFLICLPVFLAMTNCSNESPTVSSIPDQEVVEPAQPDLIVSRPTDIPQALIDQCLNAGRCTGLVTMIQQFMRRWENNCITTDQMVEKALITLDILALEAMAIKLGLEEDVTIRTNESDYCGGLFDPEITFIEICTAGEDAKCWPGSVEPFTIEEGNQVTFQHQVRCSNGFCDGEVIWNIPPRSDGKFVASVDQAGVVTGRSPGSGELFAFSRELAHIPIGEEPIQGSVELLVPLTSVEVVPTSTSLGIGETVLLKATLRDAGGNSVPLANRVVTWTNSDPTIAEVDANDLEAVVKGKASGEVLITATTDGKSGTATVTVLPPTCPDPPVIPDCSHRELKTTRYVPPAGFLCTGAGATLDLDPEDEVYIGLSFTDYLEGCIDARWGGTGAQWRIVDQNGTQLNWDSEAYGGIHDPGQHGDTLWERGNAGSCGHPVALEVLKLHPDIDANAGWKAVIKVFSRPGWNRAGTDFITASPIGQASSWCGSVNEAPCGGGSGGGWGTECDPSGPPCSTNPVWRVDLETGGALQVAASLKADPTRGGTIVDLNLHDAYGGFVRHLREWFVSDAEQDLFSYTHNRESGTYFVVLNVHGTTEDSPGRDLWEYAIGFTVLGPGCNQ